MQRWPRLGVIGVGLAAAVLAVVIPPARADDQSRASAKQVVGLFLRSCVNFAGDRDGLLNWAKQTNLQPVTDEVRDQFLYGLPGTVFDATIQGVKLVLVSEDSGSCSALAERAEAQTVIGELERILRESRVKLNMVNEHADAKDKNLHYREYTAVGSKREWQMLVSTVDDPPGGGAMLTANPW